MIFADKQYPVNIKNASSFIYPANSMSLGDNILMTMISQAYLKDNPDEAVSLLPFGYDILEEVKRDRPNKLFLRSDATCITDKEIEKLKRLTPVFEFELHRECHELWKQGNYPVFNTEKINEFSVQSAISAEKIHESELYKHWIWNLNQDYIVFHIRNIQKIKSKNTDPEWVENLLHYLIYNWATKLDKPCFIVLVGNDTSYGRKIEHLAFDSVIDLRKKLTISEIARVIEQSKLFVGSDSGIAHLAGCCNVPMVCWGFQNEYWFPKVRNIEDCMFLTKEESRIKVVLREIGKWVIG